MHPTTAVIIPTFNRRTLLARALDSVYAQTCLPDEVCVVDDGSTDDTAEFVQRCYPQANYVYQPNSGVSASRNHGVRATSADWLAFLDSDDEWLPEKLQLQMAALMHSPQHRLVHSDEIWMRNNVRVNPGDRYLKHGGDIFLQCLEQCAMAPSSVVIQRSLFEELGGFDESFPACEDYDLWLKICSRYPVLYLNAPLLVRYGGHADQLSASYWGMDRFRVQALANLLSSFDLDDTKYAAARAVLAAKCQILRQGALKRNKQAMVEEYSNLMQKYPSRERMPV